MHSRFAPTVGVLALVLAAACSSPSPATSPAAAPTAAPAAQATSAPPAPAAPATVAPAAAGGSVNQGDIQAMAKAMAAATSYRMQIQTTDDDGTAMSSTVEIVKPDKTHVKAALGGGKTVEMIQIGKDQYTNATGTWVKQTGDSGVSLADLPGGDPDATIVDFNKATSITRGAQDNVGGTQCQEWIMAGGAEDSDNGSVCVGGDNLPRQFKSTDGKTTLTFSDWNQPIAITAPV